MQGSPSAIERGDVAAGARFLCSGLSCLAEAFGPIAMPVARARATVVSGCDTSKREAQWPSKTNLVLVPGLLCTQALWAPQMAALCRHRRHHRRRPHPPRHHGGHRRLDPGRGAASALRSPACRWAATSPMRSLRQAPQRVTRLALLDTGSRADAPERTRRRLRARWRWREREGAVKVQEELHAAADPQGAAGRQAAGRTPCCRWRWTSASTRSSASRRQSWAGPTTARCCASIRCPTLVLVGREDALTPVELSEEIAAGIPARSWRSSPSAGISPRWSGPRPSTARSEPG